MRLGMREKSGKSREAEGDGGRSLSFKMLTILLLFVPHILATLAPFSPLSPNSLCCLCYPCFLFSSKLQFPPDADTLILGFNSLGVTMEVGQKVCVYRLRDRVSPLIAKRLGQIGVVQDYKMTDGSGVGFLVKFTDNSATWFFEDEVRPVTGDN